MKHIPPYLFLSREDDDDVGKHDFPSVLLHSMSCKTNPVKLSFRVRIQLADTDVIADGVRIVVDLYCREKRPAEIYVCVRGIQSFRSMVISF